MRCPTNKTSGVSEVKLYFNSTLHSSVGRQLVRTPGLNCALIKNVQNKLFWGFWAQNTIKMKREMRRIHWYTAEKEKTNDTKVMKDQTYCIFYNL
jgi:hypothetical protein